jgi:hypothetical protein
MTLSSPLCRVGRKKPIQLVIEREKYLNILMLEEVVVIMLI